ncbi:MAG: GNAT family N-acetyltransferase [Bacteroidales bacterium]|nr:GNAT family N-acetyltransferase [Bacteroidales bacterium]
METRKLTENERDIALQLAWKVFLEFEAPDYPPEGTAEFNKALHDENYLAGLVYYGAFINEKLVGMIAIRKEQGHLCFFFIEGEYHRQGIGTKLFNIMKEDFIGKTITVNSSPYGLPFYKAIGFVPTSNEQITNGIRYTPMKWN